MAEYIPTVVAVSACVCGHSYYDLSKAGPVSIVTCTYCGLVWNISKYIRQPVATIKLVELRKA